MSARPFPMANPYSLAPVKPIPAGRLVVLGFADEFAAFKMRELLTELEEESVIEIGDAVVATRNAKGKVRLHQSLPLVAAGAAIGSFGGMLVGMTLLMPVFGSIAGAAIGAAAASFGDAGIDDAFMADLATTLKPGSSALFVFARKAKPELLLKRLKPFAGKCTVLQTTLAEGNEVRLRELLEPTSPRKEIKHD